MLLNNRGAGLYRAEAAVIVKRLNVESSVNFHKVYSYDVRLPFTVESLRTNMAAEGKVWSYRVFISHKAQQ